ncbi:asparaginase domain-containing protein [Nocardia sp. NPDC051833]|uniref:asparaginase domain-containing protein n=1 Tax=Nocardia sp. NPDC051833 TaxID=3155674 RepID=UPI003446AC90
MSAPTLFTLGGTISMRLVDGLAVPTLDADGVAGLLGGTPPVTAVEIARVGGSEVDFTHLRALHAAMTAAVAGGSGGLIVTTGTDSIEEVAAWLTYTGPWTVPVVVTGSMTPGGEPGSDALANLRAAVAAVATPVSTEPVVAFAGALWLGRGVQKVSGTGLAAFATPGRAALGVVTGTAIAVEQPAPAPASTLGAPGAVIARVPLVGASMAADDTALRAVAAGADAVVVAGNGAGNLPPALAAAAAELAAAGTLVVVATRAADSRTAAVYGYRGGGGLLVEAGVLLADRITPHQVRVFLTVAVSRGLTGPALRTALTEHLESLT